MKNSELLTKRFEKNIAGVLNCFDRLVLFGTYQPICYPKAMSWQLHEAGIQLIDYEKKFANKLRLEMTARIKDIATQEGIPIKNVYASVRKEAFVSEILSVSGDAPGIVCILSAMEGCRCFKVCKNHKSGYLELQWKQGKLKNLREQGPETRQEDQEREQYDQGEGRADLHIVDKPVAAWAHDQDVRRMGHGGHEACRGSHGDSHEQGIGRKPHVRCRA